MIDENDTIVETTVGEAAIDAGTAVIDREHMPLDSERFEEKLALVIRTLDVSAGECVIEELSGKTVADVNPEYEPDARIHRVAFVNALDRDVDGWRKWDVDGARKYERGLSWRLDTDTRTDTPVHTYDYPAPRLKAVGELNPCHRGTGAGIVIDRDAMLETFE